eukprot:CAMPEP_0182901578 /NCGR_PEP_ID=MMETSP0034_2-20130328/29767_1 /TAXON_ID=156128 /ORGANISM="Nephroselmis pyriformis, Strain CCMP717" /LENGTH=84 /DNA_ID=CAMNT_0025036027 /DNA_START=10 /DNA_END=264 /DNA_ORIENTATION=+
MVWINYMLVDNLLLAWTTSFKNAALKTTIAALISHFATSLDPFAWFERYDDDVMRDCLDDELADEMEDVDDLEADDVFSNPFES